MEKNLSSTEFKSGYYYHFGIPVLMMVLLHILNSRHATHGIVLLCQSKRDRRKSICEQETNVTKDRSLGGFRSGAILELEQFTQASTVFTEDMLVLIQFIEIPKVYSSLYS